MRDKVTKITRSMKRITALLTLFLAMTFISCKSGKTVGENPFFAEWETPYGVPPFDKIEPEHFLPAIERGMSLHEAEIDAITSNNDAPTFENVILAYDASGKMLSQVELIFGMLCAAENTSEMQALEEQIMPRMAAHADKIRLNGKLFERIKAVYDRRAALGLDAEQSRLLEKTYRSFVRAGALLDAERKARLIFLSSYVSQIDEQEELFEKSCQYGAEQLAWLKTEALQLPEGWAIFLFSHALPKSRFETGTDPWNYMEYASEPAMMLLRQAQKHGIRIGGWFAGHYACDYETTFCHIPYFLIDSVRPQPIKSLFPNVRKCTERGLGAETEDLWDVLLLKPKQRRIYLLRFGAGEDRVFDY